MLNISLIVFMAASPVMGGEAAFSLHPPAALPGMVADSEAPTPFIQAAPIGRGRVAPDAVGHVAVDGAPIDAIARPMIYWPDGSVRLLLVDGVVSPALLDGRPLSAALVDESPRPADRNPVRRVEVVDDAIVFLGGDGGALATLALEAAWAPVTEEKIIYPDEPELNDAVAQYGWAHPLGDLAGDGAPRTLHPRVRDSEVEAENAVFTDYAVRGDCGDAAPGDALEWQLRLRVYRATPVVRWQMTWKMLWDPDEHALARAAWVLRPANGIQSAVVPDEHGAAAELRLERKAASMRFAPNGDGVLAGIHEEEVPIRRPDERWHRLLMRSGNLGVGLAVCDLSRLGPSHVRVSAEALEVASWSDKDGLGMDLRSSITADERGIGSGDLEQDGRGVAFSLDGALVLSEREADVEALTRAEATREHLWFASAGDWYRTGALRDRVDPEILGTADDLARGLRWIQRNAYFLIRSRDHWRWYGALNYGDVRTNYGDGRWQLGGRHGWRNGSGEVYDALIYFGLMTEDRTLTLFGLDYARHVADVDVKHSSFFRDPKGDEGGMHRRNKDHWSGDVQTQYTPSRGLYMASWLNGDRRIADVLEEVRAYTRNADRTRMHSVFPAAAWLFRYAETHDEKDLALARRIVDACAEFWSDRGEALDGLSSIYQGTGRRVGDGLMTLVDFHNHTGDPDYLNAILESARRHRTTASDSRYVITYLLANGVSEDEIGEALVENVRGRVRGPGARNPDAQPMRELSYERLRDSIGTGLTASLHVAWHARAMPFPAAYFHGQAEKE